MRSLEPGGGAAAARLLPGPERVAFTTSFDGYAVASFVIGTRITFPIYLYAALRFRAACPR